MEEIFVNVLTVILPVVICASIGFCLAWAKVPFDSQIVGSLVTYVGYPTLIISHLSQAKIVLSSFFEVMAAFSLAICCFAIISAVILKLMGLPIRAFISPMSLNNTGNIGLPVSLLAFGSDAMAYTMGAVVVVLVGIFTFGMWIPSGRFSFMDLAKSPVIYATIIALGLVATGTDLPKPLASSFDLLGNISIPLMLLTLGFTLATIKVATLGRACLLAILHIAMAAVVAWGLLQVFDFTGTERGVFVLCCLMPPSVATYLFVDKYQPDHASEVAGFILVSTLLTVIVLTLTLTYWV